MSAEAIQLQERQCKQKMATTKKNRGERAQCREKNKHILTAFKFSLSPTDQPNQNSTATRKIVDSECEQQKTY